ncbi:MAG TPA: HAMP domain-containing sensor histidine kinase [Thermomicrobiales bacterium]|nr:HAMP domain-containing sensor histidine kinase [Thermomicrobiales bacterium]
MSEQPGPRTLPMRRWLALALLVTFLIPACVIVAFAVASVRENPHDDKEQAADSIRDGADSWNDPAWQETMRSSLARDNVAFILFEGDREIYRSAPDPFAGADGDRHEREVELVVIRDSDPEQIGYVYADEDNGPPDNVPVQFIPIIGLTTLALTLTGIAWFLGRTILRPLAATSQAARQVASGDLDIALPRSRVREVDEVNSAFDAMSSALRTSLEEQAELEQERRLFIGAIAHDLRTPLFALRGYLEGLESGIANSPEQRTRYIATAREKADALERLISDLFDFSRLEYLDQTPVQEPLDLADLLRKLASDIQPLAATKGVAINVDEESSPCAIHGDRHLLTRAIENLLDNALRFSPAGGSVRITCGTSPTGVTFSIVDTGPGISAADLPNIFNPLYRGESSRNRRTGGAGLGLTIARRILLAHGGDLTAANRLEGGAAFIGTIPIR